MADPADDFDDDKPLDPAMEKVRRKLARLMAVSIGIMLVGLMAVLGAVVYKSAGSSVPQGTMEAVIDRILFFGKAGDGASRVLIFDANSASLIANHRVQ